MKELDGAPKILLGELRLRIFGDINLSNEQVEKVRRVARFAAERIRVIIECLSELDAGARSLEIEVRIDE